MPENQTLKIHDHTTNDFARKIPLFLGTTKCRLLKRLEKSTENAYDMQERKPEITEPVDLNMPGPSSGNGNQEAFHETIEATGYGDVRRCSTCGRELQQWEDPRIEHARWFPLCGHVRQTRGQESIDLVQRAANQSDEDDDPAVVMQTPSTASINGAMGGLSMTDTLSSDAAKQPVKEGFSKKAVILAIHELYATGKKDVTASSIIEVLNSKKARGEALLTDSPPNEAEDIDSETVNDPENLQRENQRLKMIIKCVKCELRDANILFIPCTHHKMCEECAEDALLCPACGRDIDKKVKTYMS